MSSSQCPVAYGAVVWSSCVIVVFPDHTHLLLGEFVINNFPAQFFKIISHYKKDWL